MAYDLTIVECTKVDYNSHNEVDVQSQRIATTQQL